MTMTCLACRSPQAAEIASLLDDGMPLRDIARQVSLDWRVIGRHKKNGHHLTPAFLDAVEEREKLAAESRLEAIDRCAGEQRVYGNELAKRKDFQGASKCTAREADVHLRVLHELKPPDESAPAVKISFSFAGSAWRPNASGEVAGATEPVPELQAPATGIELQVPASAIPENVAPPEVETEEAKFVREGFEKLDRLREQDARDEARSALVEPRYEPRRGGF